MGARKTARKVNWPKVWDDLDTWFQGEERKRNVTCNKCKHTRSDSPEWEEQMAAIERIVNAQLHAG